MMNPQLLEQFANRLEKNDRHRSKLARRQELDCFRVYDRDLPQFPFTIDRYADHLYVAHYRSANESEADQETFSACWLMVSQVLRVDADKIHLKQRRPKAEPEQQYQKLADEKSLLVVREGGLRFYVNLTDYLDTGLFLDHRKTREKFRQLCRDARVLNLFCYTGAFSVYAADGSAKEVVSVDLSNTYLNWAQRNLALNRLFDPEKHRFVRADVLQYLQQASEGYFDLVILDPPTFSNSKAMQGHLDIQRDHGSLINQTLRAIAPGGTLYFSTNCRKFNLDRSAIDAEFIKDITQQTVPFDFPDRLRRWCFVIRKSAGEPQKAG
jgi:23S rRNA (cytosine1962-C5)-methyltransferase